VALRQLNHSPAEATANGSATMNKDDFTSLFLISVRQALAEAQKRISVPFSQEFDIELHGGGVPGKITPLHRVVDIMYLGEELFYVIIDVGVKAIIKRKPIVFVRISDHEPSSFEKTWNTPRGNGPFKVIEAVNIHIDD
jgi:hypothetical protein